MKEFVTVSNLAKMLRTKKLFCVRAFGWYANLSRGRVGRSGKPRACLRLKIHLLEDWELDTLDSLKVWPVLGLVTLAVEMLLPRPLSVLVVE